MKEMWKHRTARALPHRGAFDRRRRRVRRAISIATFQAVDVKTGDILWKTRLGTSVQGFPVTFSVGGKQYIAVTTGLGGGSPRDVPRTIIPEVKYPDHGHAVYVFELPDKK